MTPWRSFAAWFGGLSLSWVLCSLALLILVHVLRRKGYAVRLGMGCLIFRAVPGSRRFPRGVEVRVSTRLVGFVFGGCRGPWLDLHSNNFCMRLRGEARPRRWARDYRVISRYLAIDRGYWRRLMHNILMRIALLFVRGLRVRASKVRIWKDGAEWEFAADTFVMAGCASGVFGSKYSLSLNEMTFRTLIPASKAPMRISCTRGIEVTAHLSARFIGLLFARRHSLVDDLLLSCDANNLNFDAAGGALRSGVKVVQLSVSPRLSRSLRSRLPPGAIAQERVGPTSIIRAWEVNASFSMATLHFSPPPRPAPSINVVFEDTDVGASCPQRCLEWAASALRNQPDKYESWLYSKTRGASTSPAGAFVRLDRLLVDAYGIARNEKGEPALHSDVALSGLAAGSLTVDELSREVYERSNSRESKNSEDSDTLNAIFGEQHSMSRRGRSRKRRRSRMEQSEIETQIRDFSSADHLEKIVASRPEIMLWIDEISAAIDANMKKTSSRQMEVGASGMVAAIEPIGLASLVADAFTFLSIHKSKPGQPSADESYAGEPIRAESSSSLASDSMVSIIRSASSSSLNSLDGEPKSLHVVAHLRHCRVILLGRGPVGDGDTIALIASANTIELPSLVRASKWDYQFEAKAELVKLLHWTEWSRSENFVCENLKVATRNGEDGGDRRKLVTVKGLIADWDLDLQSAFGSIRYMVSILKHSVKSGRSIHRHMHMSPEGLPVTSPTSIDEKILEDAEGVKLTPNLTKEERAHRDKILQIARKIAGWDVAGNNVSVAASFPDGPRLSISAGVLPEFALSARTYFGEDCVLTLFEKPTLYVKTLKLLNPLYTLGRSVSRPKIEIEGIGIRGILGHEVELGSLIQDWLIRFRAVVKLSREDRYRRAGIKAPPRYRVPTPDIFFRAKDLIIYLEDHPLAAFFTDMLPLFQDESRIRIERHALMSNRMETLNANSRSEIAGTAIRCQRELYVLDSQVWVDRVRKLKECRKSRKVADGYLHPLNGVPLATLSASTLEFQMVMDEQTHHEGSKESMRKIRYLDEYQLGNQKRKLTRQYEPDSWNSIGFRNIDLDVRNLVLQLRDYPDPFLKMDHAYFDKTVVGQGVQATLAPYITEACVAVGQRRLAKITKGLGNMKTYANIHLIVDELTCHFNPAQLGVINDFGRGCSRFSSGGKNPSPRIPWFDTLRVSCHGRFLITAKKLKGTMASSNSPYTKTKHFTYISAEDVRMVASRMRPTAEDRYPISWTLRKWHVKPCGFSEERQSDIGFDYVCVGLTPVPECYSGDPQDHYFIPIPSKEDVRIGGAGIGRGTMEIINISEPKEAKMNPLGCYTTWDTGLHRINNYDSYKDFKTRRMTLGIDIHMRHPESMQPGMGIGVNELLYMPRGRLDQATPRYWAPLGASLLHSDGLSTLIKVIKNLIRRPISCRVPPRMIDHARKPPSLTGLSSSLVALNLHVNVSDLNLMLYNNLQQGHGIFVSCAQLVGELGKRATISWDDFNRYYRDSKVSKRRVEINNLNTSVRMPDIDLAADETGTGRLLSVSRIFLSDDVKDEPEYAASPRLKAPSRVLSTGFGSEDHDKSPFYTFSASHAFQRERPLDKVKHDMRIAVDEVRLLWSPARRTSLWAWPDAFREKLFAMKAASVEHDNTMQPEEEEVEIEPLDMQENTNTENAWPLERKDTGTSRQCSDPTTINSFAEIDSLPKKTLTNSTLRRPQGTMVDILKQDELDSEGERKVIKKLHTSTTETLETHPKFEFLVNSSQVCIGSPETAGLVFLTSDAARIGIVEKLLQRTSQTDTKSDRRTDKEHRVHLKESSVYCQTSDLESFDFGAHIWVPDDAHRLKPKELAPFTCVTTKPMSMDLMYISSSSSSKGDDEDNEDFSMRPSLLLINLREISMASTSVEFQAVTDVVRKVLMHRAASSIMVKEELAQLRYNLQLRNRKITMKELDDKMRRLNTITKQFLYAADTSQEHLVDRLLLANHSFEESLQRYKAKAKAVATFIRTDQRASTADYQYPTMYISYSFDKCSWELREIQESSGDSTPIVEICLSHLVCRHIFYVGRGSSAEITFESIRAINRMHRSYFQDFLRPASVRADRSGGSARTINASDGAPVAFRWYSTQTDKVGGISVYDLLTIQVAPLNAAVSRRLYSAVSKFIFPPRDESSKGVENSSPSSARSSNDGRDSRGRSRTNSGELSRQNSGRDGTATTSRLSDVTQMARRGDSTVLFKYVFIDAFELTASFKNKDKDRSVLDFSNLFVTTPSFSYSSEIWTWKDFANRIKRDLVFTFARRGVSTLAKIKFIPGYSRAKRRLFQGAGVMQRSIANRLHRNEVDHNDSDSSDSSQSIDDAHDPEDELETYEHEQRKAYVVRVLYGKRSIHVANELQRIQEIVADRVPQANTSMDRIVHSASHRGALPPSSADDLLVVASQSQDQDMVTYGPQSRPYRSATAGSSADSQLSESRSHKQGIRFWGRLRRR